MLLTRREGRQSPVVPALAAAAHLDAFKLGCPAGQRFATAAAARNLSRSRCLLGLCSTRHRESDRRDREVSQWVIYSACRYIYAAYCRGCADLVKLRRRWWRFRLVH